MSKLLYHNTTKETNGLDLEPTEINSRTTTVKYQDFNTHLISFRELYAFFFIFILLLLQYKVLVANNEKIS